MCAQPLLDNVSLSSFSHELYVALENVQAEFSSVAESPLSRMDINTIRLGEACRLVREEQNQLKERVTELSSTLIEIQDQKSSKSSSPQEKAQQQDQDRQRNRERVDETTPLLEEEVERRQGMGGHNEAIYFISQR